MKKNRITDSLNQELRGVRVSPELRRRILANARSERFRRRRRNASALSAIAAVLVVALMVVGGLKVLRKPAPDRKYVQGDTAAVWIDEVDRTYHSKRGCSEHNMRIVPASEARARGFTACRKCIPILKTPEPTPDATEAPEEITPEPTPVATEAPVEITPQPTPVATEAPVEITPKPSPVATEAPVEITPEVTPDASLEVTPTVSVTIEPESTPAPDNAAMDAETASSSTVTAVSAATSADDTVFVSVVETKYHLDPSHITGNRIAMLRSEALLKGYLPCTECGANDESYWMTDNGYWFHSAQNCKNMSGAYATSALYAIENGKEPCKLCIGQEAVWMTDGGVWYHATEHCQNMSGAIQVARSVAEGLGKARCPYCFVEPDDPSWMYQLDGGVAAQLEAFESDGRLIVYLQADSCALPLLGDSNPSSTPAPDAPDRTEAALVLSSLSGNLLSPILCDSVAESIANGDQIGLRAIRYEVRQIHAYDESGEIPILSSHSYVPDFTDTGILYVAETDASRSPTRVSIELAAIGCSYYLNEYNEWEALEAPYAFTAELNDADGFYRLFMSANGEKAEPGELQVAVSNFSHASYTPVEGCTLDAYGTLDADEFSIALLTDSGAEDRITLSFDEFDSALIDSVGAYAQRFESTDGDSPSSVVILIEPSISRSELKLLSSQLGQRSGAYSAQQSSLSAERAALKNASTDFTEYPASGSN